jgi:predicted amidophosphoribosyltransferase
MNVLIFTGFFVLFVFFATLVVVNLNFLLRLKLGRGLFPICQQCGRTIWWSRSACRNCGAPLK